MRQRAVVVRLLLGEPRTENAARPHGTAHEKCVGGGQVPGIAPQSTQGELHGSAEPSATRHHPETVHRLQWYSVVLP